MSTRFRTVMKKYSSDILIIGSGIAGLSAALKLAPHFSVSILTKREAMETNTRYAQGGIASVTSKSDDFDSHIQDTLVAGAGLCHQKTVEKIVKDGPRLMEELINWGVEFSKTRNHYDLGREGGHSQRRVLHAGDMTGNELQSALFRKVKAEKKIQIFENHLAIDLITAHKLGSKTNRCLGAYALERGTQKVHTFTARTVILATGGAGKVYLYTSNPDIATGDGIAMAYRAGAAVANLEFVQFHPTCLYNPSPNKQIRTFLISEAVRGEGAILKNLAGERFMKNYHPLKELAPRDVVARAIDHEMKKRGDDYVWLDLSHKPGGFIRKRFPNIYRTCKELGYDLTSEPVPVVPAAHYFCGGIQTDLLGRASIDGLYALGEAACTGLHGANRLASNSLLEALAMSDYATTDIQKRLNQFPEWKKKIPEWNSKGTTNSDEAVVITHNWDEIRRLMWNYVGIVRSNKRLKRALARICALQEEVKEYYWNFKVTPDLLELRNLVCVAELTIRCALKRKESRGLHYNLDTPKPKTSQRKDTVLRP